MIATGVDVAKCMQAEEVLEECETQTRLLLDSTEEVIYAVDTRGICIFASLKMVGHQNEEYLVAQDVEVKERLYSLALTGRSLAQGFLFSKPVPTLQVTEILKQQP